ncbi:MAG TPA: OmpA family protein, partial [Bryobacteraceae bacterium]|nr:OmpA family protein [Bryobacteraceae bacterium]
MMKRFAALGALSLMACQIYAQGLNPGSQTKNDWEEINFEFNSAILSDGYPSLLRLADLLTQHRDYKVRITGHTDFIGSERVNQRLALARANTVRDFLVKYGASPDQITTESQGKNSPEVSNNSREGRFINRRVVLTVTNAQGQVIKEGSISEVLNAVQPPTPPCCDQVLAQLKKLDDILAALKNLQGENDQLRGEIADLRNQQNTLRDQVNGLPKPLTSEQAQNIAHTEAQAAATTAVDEAQRRNKKFSNIGIDIGPVYGPTRGEDYTVSGHAQFFSPFGGDGTHAVQAQGEYLYYPGQQEGQFDIGLVNRWGHLQAGGFGSFKYLSFNQYQNGGVLGQAAFLADYLFSRGRVGGFATKGFRNIAVLNSAPLGPGAFLQTYARVVDQYGVNALVGVWGNASIEGNIGYLRLNGPGADRPGAMIRLVQPLNEHVSFTTEIGLNETLVTPHDHGRVVFGLEFGNFIRPKDYGSITTPVPMEVPRVRYQLLTRRVGNSPPVADAGADQIGVRPGTITLNGSASYDPDGDPLTFSWEQIGGPNVPISGANTAVATFPASSGQSYAFRLTVKDPAGAQSSARTTVTVTAGPASARIVRFDATPSTVPPGQAAILNWVVEGATSVTITPGIGSVNVQTGSTSVTPPQTTTYTLTATGPGGTVHASTTVTVGGTGVSTSGPQIVRFAASPETIQQGQQATLSWATNGATQVSISGVGTVGANGSTTVSPAQTTTYTLTAAGPNGQPVTAPVTVTVTSGTTGTLQIQSFTANPQTIAAGAASQLCWQVSGAASIAIQPSVGASLNPASGCASVSPAATTTYTLTATGASHQSVSSSVTVTVSAQPSPTGALSVLTFTANPGYTEFATNPSWLGWSTTNASYVVIT